MTADKVQITEVGIGRTYSLGNYESLRIDARAEVRLDIDSPEAIAKDLLAWCNEQREELTLSPDDMRSLRDSRAKLKREVDELEALIAKGKAKWEKARTFLSAHGLTVQLDDPDDIPF